MPQAHNLPSSLYMFKQLMKVQDISEYEHHSCELGCTGWGVTPKHEWHRCQDHVCSKCGGKRFKTVMGRLVPMRVRVGRSGVCGCCLVLGMGCLGGGAALRLASLARSRQYLSAHNPARMHAPTRCNLVVHPQRTCSPKLHCTHVFVR